MTSNGLPADGIVAAFQFTELRQVRWQLGDKPKSTVGIVEGAVSGHVNGMGCRPMAEGAAGSEGAGAQAVVADAVEAPGQNVDEEATDHAAWLSVDGRKASASRRAACQDIGAGTHLVAGSVEVVADRFACAAEVTREERLGYRAMREPVRPLG